MQKTIIRCLHHIYSLKVILTIILASVGQLVFSQLNINTHDDKRESRGYHFGIHLAAGQHTFKIDHNSFFLAQNDILSVEGDKDIGIDIGLIGAIHPFKNTEVRVLPTLNFGTKNITYTFANQDEPNLQDLETVNFEIPLHFKYKSKPYKDMRMFVIGGGKYGIDLSSNKDERNLENVVKLEKGNAFLELGAGAEFHFPLFVLSPEIKVSHGFLNQHVNDPDLNLSAVLAGLYSRVYTFSINIE